MGVAASEISAARPVPAQVGITNRGSSGLLPAVAASPATALPPPGQRIAVARDEAFTFLYPHLIAGWRRAGAELIHSSPLGDEVPPEDCDLCWLPGGYPELHAGRIAAAKTFLEGMRAFAKAKPVHGECGGYMVLGQGLTDAQGVRHTMACMLPLETSFATRKLHLGYRQLKSFGGPFQTWLRGHEFHYSTEKLFPGAQPLFQASTAAGEDLGPMGQRMGRLMGSYAHVIAGAP